MTNRIYQGHLPRKCFGQFFLHDQNIINNIVRALNPQKNQAMIEIGPGLAALTKPVSMHLDHLTVIDLDYNLIKRLIEHPYFKSKLTIYHQDALSVDYGHLSINLRKSLRIFGNLPYNISTALIFHLFKYINVVDDMHFMFQKEVADRLLAQPNSKKYGRLSVMAQYHCQVTRILEVPPIAFYPIPKVNSTMIRLLPYSIKPYSAKEINILDSIIRKAFNQRRKMICNSLNNLITIKELRSLKIEPDMRAENLSISQYCDIANYISDITYRCKYK